LAGSKFVVAGYGWCGRGLASRARGAGAEVIITEIDPTKALEAVMDGFRVMSMDEAAKIGDVFCTVTGNKNVLARQHFELMKDGAIISNSGHFNVEIDIPALEKLSSSKRTTRTFVDEYTMKDGRRRRPSGVGDGYELCRPGVFLRVHGEEPRVVGKKGLPGSGGTRQTRGQAQAGIARHQDRPLNLGAGRIPGQLVGRNVGLDVSSQFSEGRRQPPACFVSGYRFSDTAAC